MQIDANPSRGDDGRLKQEIDSIDLVSAFGGRDRLTRHVCTTLRDAAAAEGQTAESLVRRFGELVPELTEAGITALFAGAENPSADALQGRRTLVGALSGIFAISQNKLFPVSLDKLSDEQRRAVDEFCRREQIGAVGTQLPHEVNVTLFLELRLKEQLCTNAA